MAKLRDAFSKTHLKRLGQDTSAEVKAKLSAPATDAELRAATRAKVLKRRARPADERPDRPGLAKAGRRTSSHEPANGNAKQVAKEEPQAIRDARVRLRGLVKLAMKGAPPSSIGIVLAIVNQETGNHGAANALIEEYELERLFGIKKFTPNT